MDEAKEKAGQAQLRERVLDAGLCTGCGACIGLCPYQTRHHDETIQLHPCDLPVGRCYAFCPRTPADLASLRALLFHDDSVTPELGAVRGYFVARARDERLRSGVQHGGTVTALLGLALEEGLIDAAVVSEGGADILPRSTSVTDADAARRRGKSRFLVSHGVAEFNRLAASAACRIGVVATPCQALALAKMQATPLPAKDNNIGKLGFVVGLFCGWTLSWRGIAGLLRPRVELASIRGMEIPPGRQAVEFYTGNETIRLTMAEIEPVIREACRGCVDTTAEFADISVGSARLPLPWEELRGWNQVVVRTARGEDLLALARARGVLELRPAPPESLADLKRAAREKKLSSLAWLQARSGRPGDLLYLDSGDPVIAALLSA
jgi:coenzyme F420 hydrogenase subunit beta